jgi:hypothetical protein
LVSKKKGSTFATPNAEGVERDKRRGERRRGGDKIIEIKKK